MSMRRAIQVRLVMLQTKIKTFKMFTYIYILKGVLVYVSLLICPDISILR